MVLKMAPEKAVLWGYGPEGEQVTVILSGPVKQETSPVTVTKGKDTQLLSGGKLTMISAWHCNEKEVKLNDLYSSRPFYPYNSDIQEVAKLN